MSLTGATTAPFPAGISALALNLPGVTLYHCDGAKFLRTYDCHAGPLSPDELRAAAAMKSAALRDDYVSSHVALRLLLSLHTGRGPNELHLARTRLGKPFLPEASAPRFNMSNSGPDSLVAVSCGPEVGVDLERRAQQTDVQSILRAACSSQELNASLAMDPTIREELALRTWTCKEAILKALGLGLTVDPRSFSLPKPLGTAWSSTCICIKNISSDCRSVLLTSLATAAWCAAVAVEI